MTPKSWRLAPRMRFARRQFFRLGEYVTGHTIMLLARVVTAVRGKWEGVEPIPTQRVYFSNHVSHADFVLIWTTLPGRLRHNTRPVAGADYWEATPLKSYIGKKVFKAVLVDRSGKSKSEPTGVPVPEAPNATEDKTTKQEKASNNAIDAMSKALVDGHSLILFPEGTRNTTADSLLPFKSGLYHLAKANASVELVPVWIDNLHRVLPKGEFIPVPLACTVTYGSAIFLDSKESKNDFIKRAELALLNTSNASAEVAS